MKWIIKISFILLLFSCLGKPDEWRTAWNKHEKDFKEVVVLMDSNKLPLLPGGTLYVIPNYINLTYPCDQKVMKLNDQNREMNSSSYLFFLDTAERPIRENPVLVYTTNKMRQEFYENFFKDNVVKIEPNWYFLYD